MKPTESSNIYKSRLNIIPFNDEEIDDTLSPRVQENVIEIRPILNDIPMANLQNYSNLLKSLRYSNLPTY